MTGIRHDVTFIPFGTDEVDTPSEPLGPDVFTIHNLHIRLPDIDVRDQTAIDMAVAAGALDDLKYHKLAPSWIKAWNDAYDLQVAVSQGPVLEPGKNQAICDLASELYRLCLRLIGVGMSEIRENIWMPDKEKRPQQVIATLTRNIMLAALGRDYDPEAALMFASKTRPPLPKGYAAISNAKRYRDLRNIIIDIMDVAADKVMTGPVEMQTLRVTACADQAMAILIDWNDDLVPPEAWGAWITEFDKPAGTNA
ncbi:MAG: hypothetical protein K2X45_19430 [Phreatobacter sp.]|jgi:hypothetical protein|nr:hypothetical protein [Phreatobacter sp.]